MDATLMYDTFTSNPFMFASINFKKDLLEDRISLYDGEKQNIYIPNREMKLVKSEQFTEIKSTCMKKKNFGNMEKAKNCSDSCLNLSAMAILNKHLEMHTNENPFECKECEKLDHSDRSNIINAATYTQSSSTKARRSVEKENSCENNQTENKFRSASKTIPANGRPILMETCQTNQQSKNINNNVMYNSESMHFCKYCDKLFLSKNKLKQHSKIHSGKNLLSCKKCRMSFPDNKHLKRHLKLHNNKTKVNGLVDDKHVSRCSVCNKTFCSQVSLKNHLRTHSSQIPQVKCNECDGNFKNKAALTKHIKKCHEVRNTTEKSITKYLSSHIQSKEIKFRHSLPTKFACRLNNSTTIKENIMDCLLCSKSFKNRFALSSHMRCHKKL